MRTVYAQKNKKIILGRQGEDKAVRVVWPGIVSDWSSLYGDGSFQLSVRRFSDKNAYPVSVEVNGDDIRFTVTSAETAIAGNGKCELTYIANGTVAKSATWETVVLNSLTGQTPSEPPEEPAKSWFTAIQGQIGNLAELATTSKDNLVAAINESAQSGGGGGASVELDTTLTQSGKAADAKAVGDALAGKQNTISDLEAIRTGAAKGATALQSVPSTYRTASEQDTIDSGKVDKVTGKGLSSNDYTDAAKAKVDALAPVATSGSYNDLTNKPTIPTALPSPNALTFTGAVTGSYDGSAPLSVEIPSGGGSGSDISLGLTGATVGQIAKITAVDSNGKPTSWQAVDMPSGGGGVGIDISRQPDLILEVSEQVVSLSISEINGVSIDTTEMVVLWEHPGGAKYVPAYFRFNNEVKNATDASATIANFNLPDIVCPSNTTAAAILCRVKKINNGTYWYEFSGLQQNVGTIVGVYTAVYGAPYRNNLIGETSIKEFYVYQASNIQPGCKVSVWVK